MKNFTKDGITMFGLSDSQFKIVELRDKFVNEYCQKKGWDKNKLEIDQILEIRQQTEWISPKI